MTHTRPPELLADDFFRLCHNDHRGDLLLGERAARLGLASALLGELAWEGKVTVEAGYVHVRDRSAPPNSVTHQVLDQIIGERAPKPIRTWLNFLSLDAYERVAGRMVDANQVTAHTVRRNLLKRVTVYVPTEPNWFGWPRARLHTGLSYQRAGFSDLDVHLAGLAVATDLIHGVLDGGPDSAGHYLNHLLSQAHPVARELLDVTQAVVGDSVLSGR
jgi:hypothetical protein